MRSHPLENDCDERDESWGEIILLISIALLVGVAYKLWNGAVDGWHSLIRRARR